MPITLKLSREFYERFGDQAVNELVGALNQVDLAYRDTLKELNEANFARLDERFARVDERFARIDDRFAAFDEKLVRFGAELRGEMDRRFAEVRGEMAAGFARADAKVEAQIGALRSDMASMRADLVKWMFLFWAGTALTVIGVLKF